MRLRLLGVAAAPAALLAPAPALAIDYLTVDQAQAEAFPEADRFEPVTFALDAAARAALQARLGVPVREAWQLRVARRGAEALGAVAVDEVVGKFERITFSVAVGADGAVRQVQILTYRESHGAEVHLAPWRKQFVGKTAASPLEVGKDIANVSGATLSCQHVTQGVRRAVAVIDALRSQGAVR